MRGSEQLAGSVALCNGRIWPGRGSDCRVGGVVIHHGQVVHVGTTESTVTLGRKIGCRVIDLEEAFAMPGLNDSHIHVMNLAKGRGVANLRKARSMAELLATLSAYAKATPEAEWITAGAGWHESLLAECRPPTRRELDAAVPDRPVYIPRGGHVAMVNSLALARAGIDRGTEDPPGGIIVRDQDGEPNGLLIERPAQRLVLDLMPPMRRPELIRRLADQIKDLARLGITSFTDPALSVEDISVYQDAYGEGGLLASAHLYRRVYQPGDVDCLKGDFPPGHQGGGLYFDGLKYVADGGIEGAFLRDPFTRADGVEHDGSYRGILLTPPGGVEELLALYRRAAEQGATVLTHVTGDACLDAVLDVISKVARADRVRKLRWALHGVFLADAAAIRRIRENGLLLTLQAQPYYLGRQAEIWWGPERAHRSVPIRQFLDGGLRFGAGSDATGSSANPWRCIGWMTSRRTILGDVFEPMLGCSVQEALTAYTAGSAETQFAESRVGVLAPGMRGDVVVISEDPFRCSADELYEIASLLTVTNGIVNYAAPGMPDGGR